MNKRKREHEEDKDVKRLKTSSYPTKPIITICIDRYIDGVSDFNDYAIIRYWYSIMMFSSINRLIPHTYQSFDPRDKFDIVHADSSTDYENAMDQYMSGFIGYMMHVGRIRALKEEGANFIRLVGSRILESKFKDVTINQ